MIRTISIALLLASSVAALVAACGDDRSRPSGQSVCEAMRPDMPVKYHGSTTDAETIGNIRRANARYSAACPEGR